ncbi:MAG TPA: HEAT repeat domain-containing protein [Armatimonadaceae bacterium]|nr:HEAT repeat domain-containing protein [Armatimonadaceae bacterium]
MTTRRIILIALAALLLVGFGNFAWNSYQTRSSLARVAKGEAEAEAGVRQLMARGVLFDALQGGAPPKTRLNAIAALTALAEGGKDEAAFKQLLQMLKDPDTEAAEEKKHPVRDAAKDAVAKIGPQYPDLLLDAAKDPDKNIQEQSRAALKQIGAPMKEQMAARLGDGALRVPLGDILAGIGPETVPLIAPYLAPAELDKFKDKPDDLAKAKIQLIEILGKFKVPEAARPMLPFRDDPDPNVRRAVVTSLANIADPIGAPVLIAALTDPNTDASARAAAAGALGGIGTPEANAAMAKALTDYDNSVANAAAAGLRRAGDSAAGAIRQALQNADPAVRARAAEAAGGQRTVGLAASALKDPDPRVRAQAAESFANILSEANAIRAALRKLATETSTEERMAAVRGLQTRSALNEVLRPGAPSAARANAVAALRETAQAQKDDKAREPFLKVVERLTDPAIAAREQAAAPLTNGADPAVIAPLVATLRDADGTVAAAAQAGLVRIGEPVVPSLVTLLSGNETQAYYASQALAQIGGAAVAPLLEVARPGKPGARWAAITLGDIRDARAVEPLRALAASGDPDTAHAASTALARVREG